MEEASRIEGIDSMENERIERFLKLLRSNPEVIENQIVKNEYKGLLEYVMEEAKSNPHWADTVPELLKLNIIDKRDKERYKELLGSAMEVAKSNPHWAKYIVPELLKLNIIDKSEIKEKYKELLESAMEVAKSNPHWAKYVVPELLRLNIIDKSDKERYRELLVTALEEGKLNSYWLQYIVPELLKLNIIDKRDKERYKELLEDAMGKAKFNFYFAQYIVPELLKLNIIDKNEIKEKYEELLGIALEQAKSNRHWAEYTVPELLKLNIIDKRDKERYKELLEDAMGKAKFNFYFAQYIVPELLKLNIIDKSEIKEKYEELLVMALEEAKSDPYWAEYIVPELLKLNIIDKNEIKEKYKELLEVVLDEAKLGRIRALYTVPKLLKLNIIDKSDKERYRELLLTAIENSKLNPDWVEYVVLELLRLNVIDKSDKERYKKFLETSIESVELYHSWLLIVQELLKLNIIDKSDKERYKKFLLTVIGKARYDTLWAQYIVPELLRLNIIDKSDKERYKELLESAMGKAKSDPHWAKYIVPELLKLNIIDKSEIKEKYKELLEIALKEAKLGRSRAQYVVPELLRLNIIDKSDKERYKELLEDAMGKAKFNFYFAQYIIPELLKLNVIDKSEINVDINLLQNITLIGTTFLENNIDVIDGEDIIFINQIDDSLLGNEIDYLYKQDYEYFKGIERAVKEKNYQKIWELKKIFYPQEEKDKLQKIEEYFGEGIRTYFVDKVPGDKLVKNRFKDPHNALLHVDSIVILARQLEGKGISKEEFLENYLGVAGDRNSGYQQLNDFLEKYASNWKELVEGAINIDGFKENEFINLAEGVLEQERTGELYKNLDNLEQILTLLHMLKNKDALLKLGKLVSSNNPQDKKLYEYYKGAIYHPRTKPIIMEMYENPGEFLGLDDTTFSDLDKIHQAKKPSNMVENFEYLDFDAKDLVDCLPLGIYDKLTYFKPFEMKFYMSGSDVYTKEELQQKIKEFLLGSDQKKISVIITKLKEQGDETMWFKEWKSDKENFVNKLLGKYGSEELINLFVNLGYSEFNKYKDLREMTAKISPKSDPNNWFNGFNCDSLAEGHGKKVVAMFNPYCTDFCIYEGDQDPKEDNLKVTSWVTLNRAIPENFTTLLGKVKSDTTHDIVSVLGDKFEDYRDPSEYVITMDNIEANPNFGRRNELAVRKIYEKFFSEYVRQNPISPNGIPINTSKFYSGVSYNKLDILTDRVPNESLPVFVNAYSDNSRSYSLQGKLDAGEQKEKEKKVGIYPLSIEDVIQISYMEGKIYPSSMKDHLGNLQHEITASILNNALKNRPNLSFAWYNGEGKIGGYILAYQGKMKDGTPGVYISDFAIDEKDRGRAGVEMIYYWMQELKKNYPDMPVFTRAREKTSYRMIKAFAGRQGYEIKEDKLMQDGGENFHRVVMEPKKNDM